MRIKYIIPFPHHDEGLAKRADQIPAGVLGPATTVECVPVRNSGTIIDNHYDSLIFDMYIVEAGIRAEQEGYDAVIMDTVSDSGMQALRSRLSIPVIGPGLVSYAVATILGKRFSIVTMSDRWRFIYEKNLATYGLSPLCASVRAINVAMDSQLLFSDTDDDVFAALVKEARAAISNDGADVILLGSTSMHQAGNYMAARLTVPVINPGPVAIKITESLVQLGLTHSKVAFPSPTAIIDDRFFSLAGVASPRSLPGYEPTTGTTPTD
jgi:allantoin racemase